MVLQVKPNGGDGVRVTAEGGVQIRKLSERQNQRGEKSGFNNGKKLQKRLTEAKVSPSLLKDADWRFSCQQCHNHYSNWLYLICPPLHEIWPQSAKSSLSLALNCTSTVLLNDKQSRTTSKTNWSYLKILNQDKFWKNLENYFRVSSSILNLK